jgi:UDP-GlcNAc:undecaprenyl-phosphate/decaprenyl-phosphate GlcNAc-1-phosphate transferase
MLRYAAFAPRRPPNGRFSEISAGGSPKAPRLAVAKPASRRKTRPDRPAFALPMTQSVFAAVALAAALAGLGIWLLRRAAGSLPRDMPNARSLHAIPVPRAGGYAIWLGFLPAALLFPPAFPFGFLGWLPAWLALVVVSARDDARAMGVAARLSVHALAALWAAAALALPAFDGSDIAGLVLTIACVALVIAWSSNLYNFMDGTDGLAGTMGAVGFTAYGVAALRGSPEAVASATSALAFFALAAAIVPFLAVNRPRAAMFLGDVGAVPLGFLAATFGAWGVFAGVWPAWFPLLVFLPFVADATLTLLRRIARRERLWEGHRGHYYQRLAQLGAGHRGTLAAYALLMAGTALTALACRSRAPAAGGWALFTWTVVVLMLFAAIDYHWRKKTNIPAPR